MAIFHKQIEDFLQSDRVKKLSKQSAALYRYAMTSFDAFLSESNKKPNIPADTKEAWEFLVDQYCKSLEQNGKSATTIKQYLTIVKMWLRSIGFDNVKFSYKTSSDERKRVINKNLSRWFTEDEITQILAYGFEKNNGKATRNKLMIRLLYESGARIREIAALTADDFELENGWFWIRVSKTVPRPAFFGKATEALIDQMKAAGQWSGRIFPDVAQCQAVFNDMLADLGMKDGADGRGPHTMRHYVATHLKYEKNLDLEDIATLLGDTPETIRAVYLHPTPKMLKRIVMP